MHVVIAGSSGFLGSRLVASLRRHGHTVTPLVRHEPREPAERRWDPYVGALGPEVVSGVDVVINLAGSPTAGNPHSRSWARRVLESRVTTTRVLAEAIAAADEPPRFLAGNGISYYGDHGSEPLEEDADPRGEALLTRVSRAWEEATLPARDAGARVCVLRTAPVIDRRNAPMKQLLPIFRAGLGVRLGSGTQHFPVISLRDWVGGVSFLAESHDVDGPFNLCCPDTPTNVEFTEALADAVGRRCRLTAPSWLIRPAAGAMAPEVLGSINARPKALERAGYDFLDEDVRDVIATALG
ncbi:TIGR01777 family oxidoreductase [Nocardioides sp. LHG3406-4]|uniref:TIGR01777 family oxidoreductase n=1 Tax=Nocardioides sp. LHG3406-4 TaxID=2804575 RepID=UPI003CEEFE76